MAVIFLGIPFGGMLGGVLANVLIPRFGWQAVFVVGGLAPLALLPVLWRMLPESVRFALHQPHGAARAAALLARLGLTGTPADYISAVPAAPAVGVRGLFVAGRRVDTVLLWGVFFPQPDGGLFSDQLDSHPAGTDRPRGGARRSRRCC